MRDEGGEGEREQGVWVGRVRWKEMDEERERGRQREREREQWMERGGVEWR